MSHPLPPPQDLAAEESVLGAILLVPNLIVRVAETGLRPDEFYRSAYGLIFQAMLELHAVSDPIDVVTLRDRLDGNGQLASVGGRATIDLLAGAVPMVGSWEQYARIVRAKAKWRRRQAAARLMYGATTYEDADAWGHAIAQADAAEPAVTEDIDPYQEFLAWYESDRNGWPTPFRWLTDAIGGSMVPGEMSLLGGWPAMGKTVLAAQFEHAASSAGARAHYYFNEMSASDLTARALAGLTGVPWDAIHAKRLTDSQWEKIRAAKDQLTAGYSRIEDWDLERLDHHIRRHQWDFAVIDTATGIEVPGSKGVYDRMSAISNTLKRSARASGTHLLLVIHLNLERCKQGKRPAPTARDLLGTGAWFQDARQVFFVHREQVKQDGTESYVPVFNGHVWAEKATHGVPADSWTPVGFVPGTMRFELRHREHDGNASSANGHYPERPAEVQRAIDDPMPF